MSRTFFRKFLAAVPRAAGRLPPPGLGPLAATSSVLYAPPPRRGRETLPRTGCRQLQRGKAEGGRSSGGRGARGKAAASGRSPGRRAGRPVPAFGDTAKKKDGRLRSPPPSALASSATVPGRLSLYLYIDMFSSGCRKCAWSSSRNAATHPWERPSLQACSRSSP